MTCENYQLLMMDRDERALTDDEAERLGAHLRTCQACRAFESGRGIIRAALRKSLPSTPPAAIDAQTLRLGLEAEGQAGLGFRPRAGRAALPAPILVALGLLTVLTVIWLGITLADFDPGQTLSPAAGVAILLIAQNAVMLFFAPVLFRKRSASRNGNERH